MRVLRAFINTAMRIDETIRPNPCNALRIPANPKRQVDMLDIEAWWLETEKPTPVRRDLNRAMLLTGARRRSILNVRREDVDLDRKILLFHHMKIGGPMILPMGEHLTPMLKARMEHDVPLNSEGLVLRRAEAGVGHRRFLFAAALLPIGLHHPIPDGAACQRLRSPKLNGVACEGLNGWFKLAGEIGRIATGTDQIDYLAAELRAAGWTGLGHDRTPGTKASSVSTNSR